MSSVFHLRREHVKIHRTVIGLYLIAVMNNLILRQVSTETSFGNEYLFRYSTMNVGVRMSFGKNVNVTIFGDVATSFPSDILLA